MDTRPMGLAAARGSGLMGLATGYREVNWRGGAPW